MIKFWTLLAALLLLAGVVCWGCSGPCHAFILALDQERTDGHALALDAHQVLVDLDQAVRHGEPIAADAQTIVHQFAHPSTGQKILNGVAKVMPRLF